MKSTAYTISFFSILILLLSSCNNNVKTNENNQHDTSELNKQEFTELMQKHLNAVTNKDLETLKGTLPPDGKMQLILPASEITHTVAEFKDYHKKWFAIDNGWTFETKILNTEVGTNQGMAIVETMYREPERDGKPYFNRMSISYDLKKINGQWYVIKDHASSIEKSTDKK